MHDKGVKTSFIYWNAGGRFDPQNRTPIVLDGEVVAAVAIDDLDGDGRDDLVVGTQKNTYIALTGKTSLEDQAQWIRLEFDAAAIATGNVNGDAWRDLALCGTGSAILLPGATVT